MKKLENISLTRLTVSEFSQHIKSVCENIDQLGKNMITDEVLMSYITLLESKSVDFDRALLQVSKNDWITKVMEADKLRDTAVSAAIRYLSVFELSENPEEHEAHTSLKTLFNLYKGVQTWNFEEETNGLENLIEELKTNKYYTNVTSLRMNTYIIRIIETNEAFKQIFSNRNLEISTEEVFDIKAMRRELMAIYNDMAIYTLSIVKALDLEQHERILQVINTVRNYYTDLLAGRKPVTVAMSMQELAN